MGGALGRRVAVRMEHPAVVGVVAGDQVALDPGDLETQAARDHREQPLLQPRENQGLQLGVLDEGVAALLEVVHHRDGARAVVAHHAGEAPAAFRMQVDQATAQRRLEDPRDGEHRRVQRHAGVVLRRGQAPKGVEHGLGVGQLGLAEDPQGRIEHQPHRRLGSVVGQGAEAAADRAIEVQEPAQPLHVRR